MLKIAERVLTGAAGLLAAGWVALLIAGSDPASLQWISGLLTGVLVVFGLVHRRNEQADEKPLDWTKAAEPAPQRETLSAADPSAQLVSSGGDPLGRWWRRQG